MRTRTLWLLSLTLTVVVVLGATLGQARRPAAHPVAPRPPGPSAVSRAMAVLRDWDRRRAHAWAADDPAAVRALYVPGSSAGRRDLAMLASYDARGLRVTTMRRQVLAVRLRAGSDRRLALEVTDRLAMARVRGSGATLALPRSAPVTRRIVLRRVGSQWRVAGVYDD